MIDADGIKSTGPALATNCDDTAEIWVVGRLFEPTFQMLTVMWALPETGVNKSVTLFIA